MRYLRIKRYGVQIHVEKPVHVRLEWVWRVLLYPAPLQNVTEHGQQNARHKATFLHVNLSMSRWCSLWVLMARNAICTVVVQKRKRKEKGYRVMFRVAKIMPMARLRSASISYALVSRCWVQFSAYTEASHGPAVLHLSASSAWTNGPVLWALGFTCQVGCFLPVLNMFVSPSC